MSERAKVFTEVLHFYNSEAKRLLLMVLAVRLKEDTRMCALWTKPDVHIGFLFQGINTGPWAYLIFHIINRIQFQATLSTLKIENKS